MRLYTAREEPGLSVTLHTKRALVFDAEHVSVVGPEQKREAPHVRAASGMCWFEGQLHIVQDDALSIARVRISPYHLDAIALPLRSDGARYFDKERGNKADKPDLEACVSVRRHGHTYFFGIGSGSSPKRTSLLCARAAGHDFHAAWFDAQALYTAIAELPGFLSSELNLEGAADTGTHMRLFQRSNGVALSSAPARCASVDVPWDALIAHVYAAGPVPALGNVQHYTLGMIDGVALSITCALRTTFGETFVLGSAEASPNAVDDGEVKGSVLGVLRGADIVWGALRDEHGAVVREKAEGLAEKPGDPGSFYVVFDPDDHHRPAVLGELSFRELP